LYRLGQFAFYIYNTENIPFVNAYLELACAHFFLLGDKRGKDRRWQVSKALEYAQA